MKKCLVIFLICIIQLSCKDPVYTPKPRAYFKIKLPERAYTKFDKSDYPYSFEYPVYATIEKDSLFFGEATENPWWINIDFKSLGGKVYISYKDLRSGLKLSKLLEDAYFMSHYHSKKADYINEPEFHTENNVHGVFYDVGGNAASAFQFFATDSVNHFLRGALYFDVTPNADSLKPLNDFLREDLIHMVKSIHWK